MSNLKRAAKKGWSRSYLLIDGALVIPILFVCLLGLEPRTIGAGAAAYLIWVFTIDLLTKNYDEENET